MSVFVKICCITSEEDALLAIAMGADALGFIFAPSQRQVRPTLVADIVKRLPPEILTIGVFRNESPARVSEIVNSTGLVGAQLHGHESPATVKQVAQSVRFVVKGFAAGSRSVRDARSYGADCILVDAPDPGSGVVFDWSLAAEVPSGVRLVLAGGLHPDNVADAVRTVQPWAVDVCTGVESAPGRKDPVKLREFIANAKAVPLEREARAQLTGDAPYDWRTDS
jgi:phosphoribosylanthranilate isomerase